MLENEDVIYIGGEDIDRAYIANCTESERQIEYIIVICKYCKA